MGLPNISISSKRSYQADAYIQTEIQRLAKLYPHVSPLTAEEKSCIALHYESKEQLKKLREQWNKQLAELEDLREFAALLREEKVLSGGANEVQENELEEVKFDSGRYRSIELKLQELEIQINVLKINITTLQAEMEKTEKEIEVIEEKIEKTQQAHNQQQQNFQNQFVQDTALLLQQHFGVGADVMVADDMIAFIGDNKISADNEKENSINANKFAEYYESDVTLTPIPQAPPYVESSENSQEQKIVNEFEELLRGVSPAARPVLSSVWPQLIMIGAAAKNREEGSDSLNLNSLANKLNETCEKFEKEKKQQKLVHQARMRDLEIESNNLNNRVGEGRKSIGQYFEDLNRLHEVQKQLLSGKSAGPSYKI